MKHVKKNPVQYKNKKKKTVLRYNLNSKFASPWDGKEGVGVRGHGEKRGTMGESEKGRRKRVKKKGNLRGFIMEKRISVSRSP